MDEKEFYELVKQMRAEQKGFFSKKYQIKSKQDHLASAKKLEKQVDQALAKYFDNQTNLF